VELVLYGGAAERAVVPMQPEPDGYWSHVQSDVREGQRYEYRQEGGTARPDPCSRWQPDGVHRPSAVFCPEQMQWSENNWAGVQREDLVIYELHVGTFTREGTFEGIIPRLDALCDLGVTAIELMPVAQFSGSRGWGYDGVALYAVQSSYGGPHGLMRLVQACHRAGLAVLLDVVYNHAGPEGNYLAEFGPYFTDRHHTPWGKAMNYDDRGSDSVRAFVTNNVRQWVRDFRVDGLRLDAVHAIYDFSARHILREIKEAAQGEAQRLGRPVHVIAESNLNDVRLLDPIDHGGYGLDGQWSDDFHHCVHTLLTGERAGYYADFAEPARQLAKALNDTFVYDGCHSVYRGRRHGAPAKGHSGDRFVVSIQTHDQVGNRACGDRFGTLLEPAQQRLAAGLLLLAPYAPLLFMGEEYGEGRPFPFFCSFDDPQLIDAVRRGRREEFASFAWQGEVPDPQDERTFESARLAWSWPDDTHHAGLRRLYRDLLTARRTWPPLRDFTNRTAELLLTAEPPGVLQLTRGPANAPHRLVAVFNLAGREQPMPTSGSLAQTRSVGSAGRSRPDGISILLSSESSDYGGAGTAEDSQSKLLPFEFQVYGPITWKPGGG
jgi:maltooligosyltrehalose trehalohydrolase